MKILKPYVPRVSESRKKQFVKIAAKYGKIQAKQQNSGYKWTNTDIFSQCKKMEG